MLRAVSEVEVHDKQKDVIINCKALCKIHIYRIIKSIQIQLSETLFVQWDGGKGTGEKSGRGLAVEEHGLPGLRVPV